MHRFRPGTRGRPWLAFLKHRRWLRWYVPPGPPATRITEDGASRRVTDAGDVRVTDGSS